MKSPVKDPSDVSSYRAIAGSSLLLKLFEKVILILRGHLLSSDSLQFGFKANTSTTQCTWLVSEVVQHLLRAGTNPIVTVLDCTKAFDLCKFSILFQKLLDTGLPPIIVRCLMYMYENQYGCVCWGKTKSDNFPITNGTRQGSILSPFFWAIYCDDLIKELRKLGVGAHVAGLFMGIACYADDVVLIAPCRQAMDLMLAKVEEYAIRHNISFSTDPCPAKSKSKCIFVCGKNRRLRKPAPLVLCGNELPWVESATHLGHELHESGTMDNDAVIKRATFISKSVEVRNTFSWASPADIIQAIQVYCSDFYGAMLWNLSGEKANQVYTAWVTAIKLAWDCPRWTKTFLVQQVLADGFTSAKVNILSRYCTFARGLKLSVSKEIRTLFNLVSRDLQSTTGQNLNLVKKCSKLDPLLFGAYRIKEMLKENEMVEIDRRDLWRIPYLRSLLGHILGCGMLGRWC